MPPALTTRSIVVARATDDAGSANIDDSNGAKHGAMIAIAARRKTELDNAGAVAFTSASPRV
jgi:hypothetical protein